MIKTVLKRTGVRAVAMKGTEAALLLAPGARVDGQSVNEQR